MDQQQPNTDPAQHAAAEIMRRLRAKERELRETQATLERERAAHGRSASAVAHHREASVVKLSIGGTHFTTSRSTLVPASGFFSAYLSGRIPPTLDDVGATFVDRDAQHFPKILAFLRDGAIPQWSDEGEREALEREADFYQIEALMRVVGPAANMVAAAGPTNERMRDEENELRALFVSARDDPRISHPHTHLIDVFSSLTTFVGGGVELDELRDVPTLARFHTHRPPATGASSVVPSVDVFRRQFCSFAGGLLEGFDWTNLVAAGSSALIPALPLPRRPETWRTAALTDADYERLCYLHLAPFGLDDRADLDFVTDDPRFFEALQTQWDNDETVPEDEQGGDAPHKDVVEVVRDMPVSTSDVDLFIHGVEDESQALAIIRRVHEHLVRKCPDDGYVTAWRGRHAVTFHVGSMKVSRTAARPWEVLKAISNKSFWHPGIDNHPFDATRCRRAPIVVASTRGNAAPARVTSDFDLLVDTPPNPLIVDLPGLGYQGYGPNRTASYTYVSSLDRRVEWITIDPGRQYIGSFRPLDNDWFKDAYLSNGAAKFSDDLLASFSTPRPEL